MGLPARERSGTSLEIFGAALCDQDAFRLLSTDQDPRANNRPIRGQAYPAIGRLVLRAPTDLAIDLLPRAAT